MHKILITLLLVCASLSLHAGWISNDQYKIIEDESKRYIKRTVLVELNEIISRVELRDLAQRIKRENVKDYKSTFISYYIKGKRNSGYWATTHYQPKLKVNIIGEELPTKTGKISASEKSPNPEKLTYDYCYAMQASTQCQKAIMVMNTESKIDEKIGANARGKKSPYKDACSEGILKAIEDQKTKDYCKTVIEKYGCNGSVEPRLLQTKRNVCTYN